MEANFLEFIDACDFSKGGGLIPVIAQDNMTKDVLMLAYTNKLALEKTFETGKLHFQSRTRGLWLKGETSGNFLHVESLILDCDNDTILAAVIPAGPACHRSCVSCFIDTPIAYMKEKR